MDGLVQMLAARLADDYCLEVIRDEAADDEKKELGKTSGTRTGRCGAHNR